jgi:hypothetical protein
MNWLASEIQDKIRKGFERAKNGSISNAVLNPNCLNVNAEWVEGCLSFLICLDTGLKG